MDEVTYDIYYTYITRGKYPESASANIKRALRKKCEWFCVKDEMLMHKKLENGQIKFQQVLKDTEVERVIKACHDGYEGGHLGRDKTMRKLSDKYFMKCMKERVWDYISKCDQCQRNSNKPSMQAPELHPVPVPQKVWSQVGMDLIGPLPETERGHKYIVAMTDYFSKFPVAAPLKNKSAAEVTKFLLSTICTFGCMETLITDQGREFVNELNSML